MVSRILVAGRCLAVYTLLLCLLSLLAFPPAASARSHYNISDGHEGDPGDGVLNPNPVVDPQPIPKGDGYPLFTLTMVLTEDNRLLPVFQIIGFTGGPLQPNTRRGYQPMQEGRWHRAP